MLPPSPCFCFRAASQPFSLPASQLARSAPGGSARESNQVLRLLSIFCNTDAIHPAQDYEGQASAPPARNFV